MEAAIHPIIQVQHLNQGKYPNLTGLPIPKFPKYPSEGHQKQLPGKVQPSEAWYDSFGFYIFLVCIKS
jgi:hypothetical protein